MDPEARHGHKTAARGFDGYKGHIAIDPDSEIITAAAVTAGNAPDASVAEELLGDLLEPVESEPPAPPAASDATTNGADETQVEVYGDASYGTATLVERLEEAGIEPNVKVQAASPPHEGFYSQEDFHIDTAAGTVCCPQGVLVPLRRSKDGSAIAEFGAPCADCPARARCTTSPKGRTVHVHRQHDTLVRHRRRQRDAAWKQRYRSTRPKVERKIGHLMRRRHGGRRARVRGTLRIGHDFALLAAAVNLRRLATLGVQHSEDGWTA